MEVQPREIKIYVSEEEGCPFELWFQSDQGDFGFALLHFDRAKIETTIQREIPHSE